ncbi:2-oxo acid dehydrogenase subunit E2 [Coxiella endosymbiont of Amblyomma nuttalli]|uniref:2-oxo acid dehydrogenase subunit E2 n=1 Tax=Coxiella endosymbiont of Amblyomma nuttalli TaxID=2749996 RepID=UPI001BACA685|nr:2-oxo acid dehydrogenase subunit E2 [Coxiella endosymbiont of Amblyomma nuttalli]QTS83986.1 Dihydrolipoyllysine-residue acetyltransferase component of pyruvate dehydrogenase complex [Coxiella endosymbiont of Amblyomma nuttalli]
MVNRIEQIAIPDLGGVTEASVIEILVKPGDYITKEESLITLESNKASMDVPSPLAGKIKDIQVKVGNKVKEGDKILTIEIDEENVAKKEEPVEKSEKEKRKKPIKEEVTKNPRVENFEEKISEGFGTTIHAGPAVRRTAHEFDIDLIKIKGTGRKGRLLKDDVQEFVKQQLKIAECKDVGGMMFPPIPIIDFSKFGALEKKPLSKIKKASGINLSRNWIMIPHVTQFGEADITELETFRQSQKEYAAKRNVRLTLLVFIIKAVISALKAFPQFNASLDSSGENLILKKYFHIGIAVDTVEGLVVPVIRDADKKGLFKLAKKLQDIGEKARTKGLNLSDMQGGCFSISSLGSIGGTAFTPIINVPEVAVLGVSQMQWKPVCSKTGDCKMRLMLPLSLSYDHRVIDGVDGARFIVYLTERLSDIRTLLL